MSILQFFHPKDGLPNPSGSLTGDIPRVAIRAANEEVAKATVQKADKRRGRYYTYVYLS